MEDKSENSSDQKENQKTKTKGKNNAVKPVHKD